MGLGRSPARWLAIAAASALSIALAAAPAAGQRATSGIIAQGAVDGVTRALMDSSPTPGESLVARVVESDAFVARAEGTQVIVTTRFLSESSRDALAAALARDLFPDPALVAVVLHRASFDGRGGFAQLHDRVMLGLALESQYLAGLQAVYQNLQAVVAVRGLQGAAPEGFQVMAAGQVRAAEVAYLQAAEAYRLFRLDQPRYLAMAPVPAELVRAVAEITAVLNGAESIESSPWGPRIRAALDSYPKPAGSPLR
jgi:hypothetical protein